MHKSGILTLSEAALLKKWGSRRTLSRAVAAGNLTVRRFGRCHLVTTLELERYAQNKRGPKRSNP